MCLKHWTQCALTSALRYKKINTCYTRRSGFDSCCTNRDRKNSCLSVTYIEQAFGRRASRRFHQLYSNGPTRELAQQIDQQMEGFSYFMPVSSVAVYGGNDGVLFEQQKED